MFEHSWCNTCISHSESFKYVMLLIRILIIFLTLWASNRSRMLCCSCLLGISWIQVFSVNEFQRLLINCENTFPISFPELWVQIIFHVFSFSDRTKVHVQVWILHEWAEHKPMASICEKWLAEVCYRCQVSHCETVMVGTNPLGIADCIRRRVCEKRSTESVQSSDVVCWCNCMMHLLFVV